MCLAKSLGGGVPIGAIVARPEYDAVLQPGDHGSTFAASPLACAAALASCAVLGDATLQDGVRRKGAALLSGLEGLVTDGLATEARGRGLMCAIDLPRARAAEAVDAPAGAGVPGQQHLAAHAALPAAPGHRPGGSRRVGHRLEGLPAGGDRVGSPEARVTPAEEDPCPKRP